jgi:hypothetical protein
MFEIARHNSKNLPQQTMVASIRALVVLLAVCSFCPLTAVSDRIPRWLDTCNALLRMVFTLGYAGLFMMTPTAGHDLQVQTFCTNTNNKNTI